LSICRDQNENYWEDNVMPSYQIIERGHTQFFGGWTKDNQQTNVVESIYLIMRISIVGNLLQLFSI